MNAIVENDSHNAEPAAMPVELGRTRPFYWSVRRELWEHRALWMAPMIAAGLILLSFLVGSFNIRGGSQMLAKIDSASLQSVTVSIYGSLAVVIALTMIVVTWFYCLDALYSERRDRSILFWKSLPVSDVTTVTSKLFVASAVAPSISFAIVVVTQLGILLIASAAIAFAGGSPGGLWSSVALLQVTLAILFGLVAQAIWFAPVLAWLIFVSATVRRSPALWAVLIPAALCLVERIALRSDFVWAALKQRLGEGFVDAAFSAEVTVDGTASSSNPGIEGQLGTSSRIFDAVDPAHFAALPAVWIGVALAVALIAATVWMRRYREPL